MSSDDWFEEIIEYDEEGTDNESEKENDPVNPVKQPKTTKDQFKTIGVFMNEHDEDLVDKKTYILLWNDLAARLNDIGPPDHTVTEWKRIWSVHKHNAKRKRLVNESDTEEPCKIGRLDESTTSHSIGQGVPNVVGLSKNEPSTSHSISQIAPNVVGLKEISGQLGVIIENQSKMMLNATLIIEEIQSSNKLLQELVKKA